MGAITVMTQQGAQAAFTNGRWKTPGQTVVGRALAQAGISKVEDVETDADKQPGPSRGSTVERLAFVEQVLRERPHIATQGKDGLSELVKQKFGVGMAWETIQRVRQKMGASIDQTQPGYPIVQPRTSLNLLGAMAATPTAPVPALRIVDARAVAPAPTIAEQLSTALVEEQSAKAEVAAATARLNAATTRVEALMGTIQSQRAGNRE